MSQEIFRQDGMRRGINFGAGPSALPEEVLEEARDALWDWNGQGMSILEIGHRTESVKAMMAEAEQDLRDLLAIPKGYHVLFLGGSARIQFAMIPMNFLRNQKKADYVVTGNWSEVAYREAKKYGNPSLAFSVPAKHYHHIPPEETWKLNEDAAYCYYTSNETLVGVQFHQIPKALPEVPLVCDMTSDLLTQSIDVSRFGLIFAGSQKNIAPAGLTVVIVHENYLSQAMLSTPTTYHYSLQAEQHSLYNTPPVFQIFMAGRMFKWLKKQGGLSVIEEKNLAKASLLYSFIDQSALYQNMIAGNCRSRVNVSFSMKDSKLEQRFLAEATAAGLLALKGHALAGGMRASLYNAITLDNVKTLIDFMVNFENSVESF